MKTCFKTVFLLSAGLLSAPLDQESPFSSFIVALWPDYDRPGVLVILTGRIESDQLPLHIRTALPDDADVVMGTGQEGGGVDLSPLSEVRDETGRWLDANFIDEEFQIEFYFNPFNQKESRKGEYAFQLNHPLENYHVAIQIPLGAERFTFSESGVDSVKDEHGLTYVRKRFGALDKNSKKTFIFSYFNKTGRLTGDILQEMLDVTPPDGDKIDKDIGIAKRYSLPTYEPYIILAMVVMAICLVFWKFDIQVVDPKAKNTKNFCPNCGEKIDNNNNKYCSNCGNKLT